MRIVFFGTPVWAASILDAMIDHRSVIVGIVTKPDTPKGRSSKLLPPPVKKVALDRLKNVPLFQPERISTPEYCEKLAALRADLFVVVAYGEIISQALLDLPIMGCINVHASLLPAYRGAAPIQRAIFDGVEETGVSIMYLVKKMDAGPVIAQVKCKIGKEMTGGELYHRLCELGIEALLPVLDRFSTEGRLSAVDQDESQVTFAPKIELEDRKVIWSQSAECVHNQIRALSPLPSAFSVLSIGGELKRVKIFESCLPDVQQSALLEKEGVSAVGSVCVSKNKVFVVCGSGFIELLEVQLEGKKRMAVSSLLCGVNLLHSNFVE